MTAALADMSDLRDNLKGVWDILQINCSRTNKESELQASTMNSIAAWINSNKPLSKDNGKTEYQMDCAKASVARTEIIEALQNGWITDGHPVFKSNEDFLQPRKILNATAHKLPIYHKVRLQSGSTAEAAVTAPVIIGNTSTEILNSARSKSEELKNRISERHNQRKNSGEGPSSKEIPSKADEHITFAQMIEGIKTAVGPIKETMKSLQEGIDDIKNKPSTATLDADAINELVNNLSSNATFTASINATLKPLTDEAIAESKKAVTASEEVGKKVDAFEARIIKLESEYTAADARIKSLGTTPGQNTVDVTSNDALLRAHGEYTRGCKEYRNDVESRSRLGIIKITLLNDTSTIIERGNKVPNYNNVAFRIGCDFTTFSPTATVSKNGNLYFLAKLTQATPMLTKQKFDEMLENRKQYKGEIAMAATTPPNHVIDVELFIWRTNKIIQKFDNTKRGFYIIHLNDGNKNLIAVTAPAQPTAKALMDYQDTCSRLNVNNPRELVKLNNPKITDLRHLIRRTHFTLNGQVLQNPTWNNPRPTTFLPFLSSHFTDGSDA